MEHVSSDSLARFIIDASIGKVRNARIDTLAIATNYAFEHLEGEDLDKFSVAYDSHVESLPPCRQDEGCTLRQALRIRRDSATGSAWNI